MLSELNEQQKKVVLQTKGPVLVLAGAGSGKTRSVIYRAAYLINEKNIPPWNILVVTFTNKAARELIERLQTRFGINTRSLWIGTFHSLCARILRKENAFLPFNQNFSIYDDEDQQKVIKKIYKDLNIDKSSFPISKVRYLISHQKNSLIKPEHFHDFNEANYFSDLILKIYQAYQDYLLRNNALDFDDLLLHTAFLLHDNKELRQKYEKLFKYVMIDEYQDTNYAQFKIINLIASRHQNLCVVGDDDQAIYSWRGATIRNILEFERDYNNVVKIKLERNYRSSLVILKLANSLIKYNLQRHQKELWTDRTSDSIPHLVKLENETREAEYIATKLKNLIDRGVSLNDSVILYRTNAQSRIFEKVFILNKIKYEIVGGVNFYQRKEIKDIVAYLRILINHQDNESLLRIINFPTRGIGNKTLGLLVKSAIDKELSLYDAMFNLTSAELKSTAFSRIVSFGKKVMTWQEASRKLPLTDLIRQILSESGLMDLYNDDDPQSITRWENLQEFISAAGEFSDAYKADTGKEPDLTEFLQNIALQTDLDNLDQDVESVKLMTMHNAKGLEFGHVFIAGLEDGLIPHSRSMESEKELEEERRLLYVALTRTKDNLIMTYASRRRIQDYFDYTYPSRFLKEMDKKYFVIENVVDYELQKPTKEKTTYRKKVILESEKFFKVGQKIKHSKFGNGTILNVDGKGRDAKLTISFTNGKLKKIMGSFIDVLR